MINELPVEEYLRGVVPRRLGPGEYPELEALKAQAVAARTTTLRNLGEFADEGYDLCGTPRCQVYGGMEDEHPLSDRAVAETAGEVLLFEGSRSTRSTARPAAATPRRRGDLPAQARALPARRPLHRGGARRAAGRRRRRESFPASVTRRAPGPAVEPRRRARSRARGARDGDPRRPRAEARPARLDRAPRRLPLPGRRARPRLGRAPVRPAGGGRLPARRPTRGVERRRAPARGLDGEDGLLRPALGGETLAPEEAEGLLFRLALRLGAIEERELTFSSLSDAEIVGRDDDREVHLRRAAGLAVFRQEGGTPKPGTVRLAAGDPLRVYVADGAPVALVHEVDARGASFDRTHRRTAWTRFRSDSELAANARLRFPGFDMTGFEILARGRSGRVGKIRLAGRDGSSLDVEGLAVRWTLDLPDTLFTAQRLTPKGGAPGWRFTGRGWGHGVGLCQVGAYGMARRGNDYRQILGHYYTGVRLAKVENR
ncbi:MAG: SpoIID/LytB domain-containing protein [Holophagales bacterium]|nr:SpoIID/LytB domain-containing protein [Holophagales bacterium]